MRYCPMMTPRVAFVNEIAPGDAPGRIVMPYGDYRYGPTSATSADLTFIPRISIHAPVRERQGGQSTLIYKKMALSIAEVYPIQLSKNRKLFETMSIHCTQNRLYNTHTCRRKGGRLRFALVKS